MRIFFTFVTFDQTSTEQVLKRLFEMKQLTQKFFILVIFPSFRPLLFYFYAKF